MGELRSDVQHGRTDNVGDSPIDTLERGILTAAGAAPASGLRVGPTRIGCNSCHERQILPDYSRKFIARLIRLAPCFSAEPRGASSATVGMALAEAKVCVNCEAIGDTASRCCD